LSHFTGLLWDEPAGERIRSHRCRVWCRWRTAAAFAPGRRALAYRVDVASSDTARYSCGYSRVHQCGNADAGANARGFVSGAARDGRTAGICGVGRSSEPRFPTLYRMPRKRDDGAACASGPPDCGAGAGMVFSWERGGGGVGFNSGATHSGTSASRFCLFAGRGKFAGARSSGQFLFVTKRGYCEYFASAMAVLLRTEPDTGRVVTGFQSGYYNDVSGSWVMRASDAHAWVEAWIDGRGWMTFDPTPPGAAQG